MAMLPNGEGCEGEPIGVYHLYDGNVYEFERIVGSWGFRDTFGESGWRRLNELGWMRYGFGTLYLYQFGSTDFPVRYTPPSPYEVEPNK